VNSLSVMKEDDLNIFAPFI